MYRTDLKVTPEDQIILIAKDKGDALYGVGPYRGTVSRETRNKWYWRAWNVIGPVTLAKGVAKTQMDALGFCTDALRKAAGIEHVVEGQ